MTRRTIMGSLGVLLLIGAGRLVITAAQDTAAAVALPGFEVDAAWPRLPHNWGMGDPSSIAVDPHPKGWIPPPPPPVPGEKKDRAAPPVLEFDKSGKFLQAWGGPSDRWEWPDTEHGIYVDYKDNVWIGGNNPTVQLRLTPRSDDMLLKFTSTGNLVMQIG